MADDVRDYFKDLSKEILLSYGKMSNIEVINNESKKIRPEWMSMILICGEKIKVCFKVYFSMDHILPLVSKEQHVSSFTNEYCNIVAGRISRDLSANGYDSKISLPLHTKLNHEIRFFVGDDPVVDENWLCRWCKDHLVACTILVVTDDHEFQQKFKRSQQEDIEMIEML